MTDANPLIPVAAAVLALALAVGALVTMCHLGALGCVEARPDRSRARVHEPARGGDLAAALHAPS